MSGRPKSMDSHPLNGGLRRIYRRIARLRGSATRTTAPRHTSEPLLEALEPRVLLSNNPFINPSFELKNVPTPLPGWDTVGVVSVASDKSSAPEAPDGTHYAVLSTGPLSPGVPTLEAFLGNDANGRSLQNYYGDAFRGSAISQTVMIPAHSTLLFQWDFVTHETTPNFAGKNDTALLWITDGAPTELANTSSDMFTPVGGITFLGAEHTGFQTYMKSFVQPTTITINAVVVDVDSSVFLPGESTSYLLLDNFQVTPTPTPDEFDDAFSLSGTSDQVTNYSTLTATKQAGEPDHAGDPGSSSMWWEWTAPYTGQVTVDTVGSGFDTLLAVYNGGPTVFDITEVASNDDHASNATTSRVTFNATAGTTYHIAVDGKAGEQGTLDLHLDQVEPPTIDIKQNNLSFPDGSLFDFGVVPIDIVRERTFDITNTGETPLVLQGTDPVHIVKTGIQNGVFEVTQQPTITTLQPNESTTFTVAYTGRLLSDRSVVDIANEVRPSLSIATNDPDTPYYSVDLTGSGGLTPTATITTGTAENPRISSIFSVPGGSIGPLNLVVPRVTLSLTKPGNTHLTVTLISPLDDEVRLIDTVVNGDLVETTFDDNAPTAFTLGSTPYTGLFTPLEPLTAVSYDPFEPGIWRIIIDVTGPATLDELSLQLFVNHYIPGPFEPVATGPSSPPGTADVFEDDNAAAQAVPISPYGVAQNDHSISQLGQDVDWVSFTLEWDSEVVIQATGIGPHDTVIYLYDHDPCEGDPVGCPGENNYLATNDDAPEIGFWSRIELLGADALSAGTYYVLVNEWGNDDVIDSYDLMISANPLISPELDLVNLETGLGLLPEQPVALQATEQGSPDSKAHLRIMNNGDADLRIDTIDLEGTGYSLAGVPNPLPTTLIPGEMFDFTVLLDAGLSPGEYTGTVTITSNDPDQPTRILNVSGQVTAPALAVGPQLVIGIDDPGFTVGLGWVESASGDKYFKQPGTGDSAASWTFTGLQPGLYRVWVDWTPGFNRSTDAPYTVMDGTQAVGTTEIDQRWPPDDEIDHDANRWERLGDGFGITSDTLSVLLRDDAASPGFLIAETVRIQRIGSLPDQIVSLNDPGFSVTDGWILSGSGDKYYKLPGAGSETATWTFSGLAPGEYLVSATWSHAGNRALDASFTVLDGGVPLTTVQVDQQVAPVGESVQGEVYQPLGVSHSVLSGTLTVQLSDLATNGFLIAESVRIQRIGDPIHHLVDIGDTGFVATTGWLLSGTGDKYFKSPGNGSETIHWTFDGLAPAVYRVMAWWPAAGNRAPNADFRVLDGDTPVSSIEVDQRLAPNDFTIRGGQWEQLGGLHTIVSGELKVRLTDLASSGFIIAGAVMIEQVDDPPTRIVELNDPGFSVTPGWLLSAGGDKYYKQNGAGNESATWTFTDLTPGVYRVSVLWTPGANRATDAPFTVYDGLNLLATADVDQTQSPDDLVSNGRTWEDLGISFDIYDTALIVELNDAATAGFLIAESIRIERLDDLLM